MVCGRFNGFIINLVLQRHNETIPIKRNVLVIINISTNCEYYSDVYSPYRHWISISSCCQMIELIAIEYHLRPKYLYAFN